MLKMRSHTIIHINTRLEFHIISYGHIAHIMLRVTIANHIFLGKQRRNAIRHINPIEREQRFLL